MEDIRPSIGRDHASQGQDEPVRLLLPGLSLGVWIVAAASWWGLAFLPNGADAPAWVGTVQGICFGTGADGLPAPYGWGVLLLAPLGMLSILLVGWPAELRQLAAELRKPAGVAVVLLVGGALLAEASWIGWRISQSTAPAPEFAFRAPTALPEGYPRLGGAVPAFALTSQAGATVRPTDFHGRVLLLTFAFGHCAQICPNTVKQLELAVRQLPAGEPAPAIAVITLDAWRDTPAALAGIAQRWGLRPDTILLSGDLPKVNATLDALRVARQRDDRTGSIDHPVLVYVVDPNGEIAYALADPPVRWITDAVRRAGT